MNTYPPYARALVLGILLAVAGAGLAYAQQGPPILLLTETTRNGGIDSLDGRVGVAVADINSSIRIRIDTDRLQRRVIEAHEVTDISDSLLAYLETIDKAAQRGLKDLPDLRDALAAYVANPNDATYEMYDHAVSPVAALADTLIDLVTPRGSPWRDTLNARVLRHIESEDQFSLADQYRYVFEVGEQRAEQLREQINNQLSEQEVFVQLGAWIVTREGDRPIHLEGFDTLPRGERFEVERTSLAITEADQQKFASLTQMAGEIGQGSPRDLIPDVKQSLAPAVSSYLTRIRGCVSEVAGSLEALGQDSLLAPAQASLDSTESTAQGYVDFVRGLLAQYQGTGLASLTSLSFVATLRNDVRTLVQRTRTLTQGLKRSLQPLEGIHERLSQLGQNNQTLSDRLERVFRSQDQCAPILDRIDRVLGDLSGIAGGARAARELKAENFEFGEKVLKLEVGQVPEETHFSLLDTGVRENEDAVVIKLATGRAEEAVKDLEFHQILLLRILPHLQLAPGLVFAYRNSTEDLEGAFQAAPSYSVLIKWLSRKHLGLTRLVRPGIGVNVATLDFENSDTVEIGFGAVLSLFHDYVQGGYGFNVHQNKGYFFFGINLPVATITSSLSPSNPVP